MKHQHFTLKDIFKILGFFFCLKIVVQILESSFLWKWLKLIAIDWRIILWCFNIKVSHRMNSKLMKSLTITSCKGIETYILCGSPFLCISSFTSTLSKSWDWHYYSHFVHQELAYCGLWAKSGQPLVCVKKFYPITAMFNHLHIFYGCFGATKAELNSHDREV